MSNPTNEDTMPQPPAGTDGTTPPAKKRAAKKAAKKTAVVKTEPVAEAAVKKTAARKVAAKKVARKSAAASITPELSFDAPTRPKAIPAPRAAKTTRARKTALETTVETTAPAPRSESPPPQSEEPGRRFGRVPGGGPVAPRESPEPRESAPPASIPYPQPTPPPDRSRDQENREQSSPNPPQGQNFQQRDGQGGQGGQGQSHESRSKRRREKRKRRKNERGDQGGPPNPQHQNRHAPNRPPRNEGGERHAPPPDMDDRRGIQLSGPKIEADGMLELAPKGFGFLRIPGKNFEQARDDIFVTPETIRKYNLRPAQWIHGLYQDGPRGPQLVEISKVNDLTPEEASKLPHFDELKAINPSRRISFETTPERFTTRVVDIMAPVGRGQRGLIVSPPRSGKTTLLLHMAEAIREKYDEAIHLMVVLVDERPEEVTEFRRALPGAEIYASSNDEQARNHTRIAELAIERAKRLVEAGRDVFLIMDSITRLARAYNGNMNNRGRGTGSGGITIGALEVPRRLFAAARNTRGGGSLTIMATALIQTNSRADEAIYMEFKGTGNMELVLDRKIAENYIYPAVDIFKSGTRREELLLADHMLHKIHLIRRGLSGHRPAEAMERLLFFLKKFPNNPQMLLEIKG